MNFKQKAILFFFGIALLIYFFVSSFSFISFLPYAFIS